MERRREQPRLRFPVVVKDRSNNRQGRTRNLSIDGCFIIREGDFSELLPLGSHIDLLLTLPNADKGFVISGVVKHHGAHGEGMGISFESIDDHAISLIQEFINAFLDDLPDDQWATVKEAYWEEVNRLKGKTPPQNG